MNSFLFFLIALPIIEIAILIKIGGFIGTLYTILLIIFTAVIGVYFAKIQGLNTLRSGLINAYQNKIPIFEVISGASIAFAAILLIVPGFFTDLIGFILLIPFSRSFLIRFFLKNKGVEKDNIIEAEVLEKENNKKDEL